MGDRIKFMKDYRLETFIGQASKLRKVDNQKYLHVALTGVMRTEAALACDPILQRAWEDCEHRERKIDKVEMPAARIPNTDIDFFELPDSKQPFYKFANVTLESPVMERVGDATLVHVVTLVPKDRVGLSEFYWKRWGTTAFLEFRASQFNFDEPMPRIPNDFIHAAAELVAPVATGQIDSIEISIPGGPKCVIDQERARRIVKRAHQEKKKK